ncbi:MAG: MBL fold metallo-hydrolase [Betaproteobacteria bacterium]
MTRSTLIALMAGTLLLLAAPMVQAAPCLIVTITGAQGGPQAYKGQAGSGTLVSYGDDADNCGAVRLQFDAGRGTLLRLSQIGVQSGQLNAIFFTHMHNDHSEGFIDLLKHRWFSFPTGPKIDVVCSDDVASPLGFTLSCRKFVVHIADALINSGEIAQRVTENKRRPAAGPAALANMRTFEPKNEPQVVWSAGDVKVSAVRSTHIAGHASYRVDTPAGSVVIGGDAANDTLAPPRDSSTSSQVEALAKGAEIIVHSTIHPVMGPDRDSGLRPDAFYRQSTAFDLGAMAQRVGAKHLVLTHLIPPPGAPTQGVFKVPGGPLTEADYRKVAQDGGFTGNIVVATDLASLRLPVK